MLDSDNDYWRGEACSSIANWTFHPNSEQGLKLSAQQNEMLVDKLIDILKNDKVLHPALMAGHALMTALFNKVTTTKQANAIIDQHINDLTETEFLKARNAAQRLEKYLDIFPEETNVIAAKIEFKANEVNLTDNDEEKAAFSVSRESLLPVLKI